MRAIICGLFALCSFTVIHADDIKLNGSFSQVLVPISQPKAERSFSVRGAQPIKTIKLLKVDLSNEKKQKLLQNIVNPFATGSDMRTPSSPQGALPSSHQLGMGKVPVLDQGMHGSCVTFASSAALNAAMDMGDTISELCQLQLGNFLADNGYAPSGWDGSLGPYVLSQMERFGFVTKAQEAQMGCAGYTSYPLEGYDPQTGMSVEEYHLMAQPFPEEISWSPLLNINDAFEDGVSANVLQQVKSILNKGDRLTFGVLLFDFDKGVAGAVGSYRTPYDSWILTPELIKDLRNNPEFGGHEMVITGYDDNAVAKDANGKQHKGLLTLRNSWGKDVGHQGNFYMSYDYFKTLVIEIQRIRSSS